VNVDKIEAISLGSDLVTTINFESGHSAMVRETPDEIVRLPVDRMDATGARIGNGRAASVMILCEENQQGEASSA
jgi:hypothetical protein